MAVDDSALLLKQLDHAQAIIQRLASNSFLLKGWAVTIVSAFVALALKDPKPAPSVAYLAAVPSLIFWLLDGYYLAMERAFRVQYRTALVDGTGLLEAPTLQIAQ